MLGLCGLGHRKGTGTEDSTPCSPRIYRGGGRGQKEEEEEEKGEKKEHFLGVAESAGHLAVGWLSGGGWGRETVGEPERVTENKTGGQEGNLLAGGDCT